MAGISGKDGSFKVGVTEYCTKRWSIDISVEELDDTTSCGDGTEETIAGISKVRGTVTMNYDPSASQLSALKPGTALTDIDLELNGTKHYAIASATVFKQATTLEVSGQIEVTIEWTGQAVDFTALYTNA